jgi:hypothetical protein
MGRRILFALCGAAGGAGAGVALEALGYGVPVAIPMVAGGLLMLAWAERTRRVRMPGDLDRRIALGRVNDERS